VGTEAFPGVVLEAFACGKPVIASALDGIPEAFAAGNYGRLAPPEDVAALATAMSEQIRHPPAALSESERLHRLVAERFSFQTMAAAVARLYLSL
jgi:glycosyltransferase involved in cell wall biosynthesis